MAVNDLVEALRAKVVMPGTLHQRPHVVLDIDEYQAVLAALTKRKPGRPPKTEVPREVTR